MRKLWTADEEQQLKDMYNTATKEEMVAKFNTSWWKIRDKAKKLGGLNRKNCVYDLNALIADYRSGTPMVPLCEKYNMSYPTFKGILKANNIEGRK